MNYAESEGNVIYKNHLFHIDLNRSLNSIDYFHFNDFEKEIKFNEFLGDIYTDNDTIEMNLIKNKAYKEAVIMSLNINSSKEDMLMLIKDEQKSFGGSKLFYLNKTLDNILVISVKGSMDGKLHILINRLNKINEKISRLNSRIKKENLDNFMKRHGKEKKESIINMINQQLKV